MMTNHNFSFAYFSALLFLFLLPSAWLPPSRPTTEVCRTENTSFQVGEELTYKIYYNWNFIWLSAGEVTFKVFDEGDTYHYQAIGKTYPSYEWFFEVDDEYNAWVRKDDLLPIKSERSVHEGKYNLYERIAFDQKERNTAVWRATHKGDQETETRHSVDNCVHDILSILYDMRNKDFSAAHVGEKTPFSVFMDKEQYNLNMHFFGKEKKKKIKGLGHFDTYKFQPELISGNVFNEGDNMTIWVGADKNRLPLLIESPVSVGSVKVVLKSYKNVRYAVDSKVK